ncbi:response regulator [Paraflavisolibacter sp. H34]|uniref:response regulator n=1 Tax=Huijunlia imazamoxiresistens TaxID=3127457 RepID=UPI00301A41CC
MSTLNNFHVLLLDDDIDDRLIFQEALSQVAPQAQLTSLCESRDLMPALEGQLPDLILVDADLGPDSSVECVQQLKAHPRYRHIPVLLWCRSWVGPQVAEAYTAGIELHFEKPWSISFLEKVLEEILARFIPSGQQRA